MAIIRPRLSWSGVVVMLIGLLDGILTSFLSGGIGIILLLLQLTVWLAYIREKPPTPKQLERQVQLLIMYLFFILLGLVLGLQVVKPLFT